MRLRFRHRAWIPIAWLLSLVNLGAVWFAARPAEPWHATVHALLAVLFALGAQRLHARQRGTGTPSAGRGHVSIRPTLLALAASFALVAEAAAQDAPAAPVAVRPEEIAWQPAPPVLEPGAEGAVLAGDPAQPGLVTIRVRLPDGYRIAPHTHPVAEYVTVLSGALCFAFDEGLLDGREICGGPGSFFVTPANAEHSVRAAGPVEYQFSALGPFDMIYVDPEDDPRERER